MAQIKNGTEVHFTYKGRKVTGTLERKVFPDGTGKGKYPRAVVKHAGRLVTVALSSVSAK